MFAKLIDNTLCPAPHTVSWKGHIVNNPSPDKLLELGYLPVTYTDMPTDAPEGQHYELGWQQTDTEIVQVWELADDPEMPEPEPTIADLEAAIKEAINSD